MDSGEGMDASNPPFHGASLRLPHSTPSRLVRGRRSAPASPIHPLMVPRAAQVVRHPFPSPAPIDSARRQVRQVGLSPVHLSPIRLFLSFSARCRCGILMGFCHASARFWDGSVVFMGLVWHFGWVLPHQCACFRSFRQFLVAGVAFCRGFATPVRGSGMVRWFSWGWCGILDGFCHTRVRFPVVPATVRAVLCQSPLLRCHS